MDFEIYRTETHEESFLVKSEFMEIIFNIKKDDKEKKKELSKVLNSALESSENKTFLYRYNLEVELLKILFEETKWYSENNDSNLFTLIKNDVSYSRRQVFPLEFTMNLDSEYHEKVFDPSITNKNYEVIEKIDNWYSYNNVLWIEGVVFSSSNPSETILCIIKYLKKKIINLNDKVRRHEELLSWLQALKSRYLDEIKDIENELIDLENFTILKNTLPAKSKNFRSDIFKSERAEKWFYDVLEELGVLNGKKGYATIIGEIWHNPDCKVEIFSAVTTMKSYIVYLNKKFNKNTNNTRLTNGTRHEGDIKRYIKNYMKNKSE